VIQVPRDDRSVIGQWWWTVDRWSLGANYWWAAAMDHLEDNDAHSWAERLDADYRFDDNPWLQSLRLGVRATNKEAITRETGWNWGFLSNAFCAK